MAKGIAAGLVGVGVGGAAKLRPAPALLHMGSPGLARIAGSEIEAPNMLVNLV